VCDALLQFWLGEQHSLLILHFFIEQFFVNTLDHQVVSPGRCPQVPHGFGGKFKSQKIDTVRHFPALG